MTLGALDGTLRCADGDAVPDCKGEHSGPAAVKALQPCLPACAPPCFTLSCNLLLLHACLHAGALW